MSSKFSSAFVVTLLLTHTVLAPLTAVAQEQDASPQQVQKTTDSNSNESVEAAQRAVAEPIDNWMPDKNLQKIVSESLGIGVQDVTKDNIKTLSTLKSNRKDININNLEGLQYATSLTSLQVYAKGLTDLSPIKSIASLKNLVLIDSSVSDFSMFNVNTSLEFLYLSPSKVYADSDRSTDVETLYNDNSVRQISEKFPNLSNLTLQGYCNGQSYTDFPTYTGKITDVSPLAKLKNLTYLNVACNEITDFSMLPDALNVGLSYQQSFLEKDITYFEVSDSGSNYKMKFPLITGVDGTLQNLETEFTSKNLFLPDKVYRVRLPFGLKSGGVAMYYGKVSTHKNQTSVDAHNSTLYTGDTWNAQDNFDGAKDRDGNPVNFQDVQVTGSVDTTQPGKYKVTYSYGGVQKEIEVTVLQKVSKEDNSNSKEDKKNENPKTLSTNEKEKVLPSTGEKSSVWLFVSGVMLFIFASALALLRLKKSK